MPLVNPACARAYINATTALRPVPTRLIPVVPCRSRCATSTAPIPGRFSLYGWKREKAAYYRLRLTYNGSRKHHPPALAPFTGLTWPLYREVGGTLRKVAPLPTRTDGIRSSIRPTDVPKLDGSRMGHHSLGLTT